MVDVRLKIRSGYSFYTSTPEIRTEDEPVVSIIIPNYNGKKTLESAITSILDQDFECAIEILVHDDNSSDGSAEALLDKYPMLHFQLSKKNVGFCISNNRMADAAHGKYLLLLNNDATLDAEALNCMLHACQQQIPQGIVSVPQYQAETGKLVDYGYNLDPFLNPIPCTAANNKPIAMVIGACLWIPLALWKKIGGFPEWFETNAEDMYLCLAARLMGHPINVCSESGYHHWIGASLGGGKPNEHQRLQTTYRRRILSERNKNFVMLCVYPMILLATIVPLHFTLLVLEGITLSIISRSNKPLVRIYWNSIYSCWKNKKNIHHQRKRLQNSRSISTTEFLTSFKVMPQKIKLALRHGIPTIT